MISFKFIYQNSSHENSFTVGPIVWQAPSTVEGAAVKVFMETVLIEFEL